VLSVVALAVRLRIGAAGTASRYDSFGRALQLVALVGVLAHAARGVAYLGIELWLSGKIASLPAPTCTTCTPNGSIEGAALVIWQIWMFASRLTGLAWIATYVAILLGRYNIARALAVLAIAPGAVEFVWSTVEEANVPVGLLPPYQLLLDGLLVLALMSFHADAPGPSRRQPWIFALAATSALLCGIDVAFAIGLLTPMASPLVTWPSLCSLGVVSAGLVRMMRRRATREPAWSRALAMLAVAVLGLRLASMLDFVLFLRKSTSWEAHFTVGLVEVVALLAVAMTLTIRTRRVSDVASPLPGSRK
jgi:hypothetical protein